MNPKHMNEVNESVRVAGEKVREAIALMNYARAHTVTGTEGDKALATWIAASGVLADQLGRRMAPEMFEPTSLAEHSSKHTYPIWYADQVARGNITEDAGTFRNGAEDDDPATDDDTLR